MARLAHQITKLTSLLGAALLLTAGAAHAGTAHKTAGPGAHIVFQASPGEDNTLDIYETGGYVYVTDIGPLVNAGQGCEQIGDNARCSTVGLTNVDVHAGDGENLASAVVSYDVMMVGEGATSNDFFSGPGDDELHGSAGDDDLFPAGGDDEVFGAGGADTINGGAGKDSLHGGEGDDYFWPDPNVEPDSYFGDGGVDTVSYAQRTAPVYVRLTNTQFLSFDGQAGEGDQVGSDVENVIGGLEADEILAQSGAVTNRLSGGKGDDRLVGGPGIDTLDAGPGADEVRSRDGEADIVDCGADLDAFEADPFDGLVACETDLAPPVPPSASAGQDTPAAVTALRIGPGRLRLRPTGVARLRLRCLASAGPVCSGVLKLQRRTKGGLRTLGRRRFSVATGQAGLVPVRIRRAARPAIGARGLRVRALAVTGDHETIRRLRILPPRR